MSAVPQCTEPALLQTPVIIMTAGNVREVTAIMIGKHVDAVVNKPFDLDTILRAVMLSLDSPRSSTRVAA